MQEAAGNVGAEEVKSPGGAGEDTVLSVRHLSKSYRLWSSPAGRLKAPLLAALGNALPPASSLSRRLYQRAARYFREFQALRDVTFDLPRGEILGVIGINGSGKSTLLQLIAGTLSPSEGETRARGRVTALLELGSGFNPEFTGRENVYLNGAILGIDREAIQKKFMDIAAFADIGEFMDQPVKTYSSGMVVRLAFAVQVLLEPDLLVVDEALAVGDIFFTQKCYAHMRGLIDRGVSIILATHDLSAVNRFCRRCLVLHHGAARYLGPAAEATKYYQMMIQREKTTDEAEDRPPVTAGGQPGGKRAPDPLSWPEGSLFTSLTDDLQVGNGGARCTRYALCNSLGEVQNIFEQGETATFFYEFEVLRDLEVPSGGVSIQDRTGMEVHTKHFLQTSSEPPLQVPAGSRLRYRQTIRMDLGCGEYTFNMGLFQVPLSLYRKGHIYDVDFRRGHVRICQTDEFGPFSVILRRRFEGFQLTHWGVADLPGGILHQIVPPRHRP